MLVCKTNVKGQKVCQLYTKDKNGKAVKKGKPFVPKKRVVLDEKMLKKVGAEVAKEFKELLSRDIDHNNFFPETNFDKELDKAVKGLENANQGEKMTSELPPFTKILEDALKPRMCQPKKIEKKKSQSSADAKLDKCAREVLKAHMDLFRMIVNMK